MANPPPVRPWFRLTSTRPVPAPAPAPAPEPRPTLSLPTFRTASAPPSPQPQEKPTEHTASLPTSPVQSPKKIKQTARSPMHSPKVKPAPPPSPLTLPPSQLKSEQPKIPVEAEPKGVLVQRTIDKPKPWHNGNSELHRESRHHGSGKESESKERKHSDSEDSGMRVITIAGENRGAHMELIQSPEKHDPKYLHKKGNSNVKVNGVGESESSGAEEGNANKNHKGRTTSSFPMAAYMNSNVQCVNNSLLYNTCCTHHDPGVRLSLSKKPFGKGYHLKEHVDGQNI